MPTSIGRVLHLSHSRQQTTVWARNPLFDYDAPASSTSKCASDDASAWANPAVNRWEQTGWFYWGDTRLGLYTGGTTEFEHQDWLGTERSRTAVNGSVLGTFTSLPFGDGFAKVSGSDNDPYHFAMLDHGYLTNTDHAWFRQYANAQGR